MRVIDLLLNLQNFQASFPAGFTTLAGYDSYDSLFWPALDIAQWHECSVTTAFYINRLKRKHLCAAVRQALHSIIAQKERMQVCDVMSVRTTILTMYCTLAIPDPNLPPDLVWL